MNTRAAKHTLPQRIENFAWKETGFMDNLSKVSDCRSMLPTSLPTSFPPPLDSKTIDRCKTFPAFIFRPFVRTQYTHEQDAAGNYFDQGLGQTK
ncbi:hypothetical protein [Rubripirellula lacrimiformis]|uniref:hypothetical protein n=1 Tax=Rubripirellula lacrimiformis TaxID=1930273 RepID=UPI001C54E134|nr:hypothetical protein [Rubripirellula lacrimiformis]